jgi:hypothetical protein
VTSLRVLRIGVLTAAGFLIACQFTGRVVRPAAAAEPKTAAAKQAPDQQKPQWTSLFDGKSLAGWQATKFGGEGNVSVNEKDRSIVLDEGQPMTGITATGKPLVMDYELSLEGIRLGGSDFFCTTTFPVGDSFCSLVVGGWGGGLVGISSIDGLDASENETTKTMDFKANQWYRVRIRVTKAKIEAWIDDEKLVDLETAEHKLSVRWEVEPSRPLGIATWNTKGAVRNLRVRPLAPSEIGKKR